MREKSVVLFLGAGASAPMGYKTTRGIYEDINTEEPDESQHSKNTLIKNDVLWNAIIKSTKNVIDIESILSTLEKIITLLEDPNAALRPEEPDQEFVYMQFGIKIDVVDFINYSALVQNALTLRDKINRKILEHYDIKPNLKRTEYIHFMIKQLLDNGTNLSIFTTNYDVALTEILKTLNSQYNFNDGFNDEEQFDPDYKSSTDDHIIVCGQLHGSTRWGKIGKSKDAVIRKNIGPYFNLNDAELSERQLMIFPTLDLKEDEYYNRPFNYYFSQFKTKIEQADICIAIGCSFRDSIITNYFQKLLDNDNKLLLIVDKVDEKYHNSNQFFYQYQQRLKNNNTKIRIENIKAKNVFLKGVDGNINWDLIVEFSDWLRSNCEIDLIFNQLGLHEKSKFDYSG